MPYLLPRFQGVCKVSFLDRNNDHFDTVLFLIAFGIGLSTALALRLWLDVNAFLVASLLCVYLFIYSIVIYRGTYTTLSRSQAADNFYYLGFLYTISTLAIALYKAGELSSLSQEKILNVIISDLGIGLATTIVGLLLRVLFTQFRNQPEEIEQRISTSLKQRASQVEQQFLESIRIFEDVNYRMVELIRSTESTTRTVLEALPKNIAAINQEVETNIRNELMSIPPIIGTMRDALQSDIGVLTEELNRKIRYEFSKLDRLDIPVDEFNDRFQAILSDFASLEAPTQNLSKGLSDAIEKIDHLVDSIKGTVVDVDLSPINRAVESGANAVTGIQTPISDLSRQLEALSTTLADLNAEIQKARVSSERLSQGISDTERMLQTSVNDAVNASALNLIEKLDSTDPTDIVNKRNTTPKRKRFRFFSRIFKKRKK